MDNGQQQIATRDVMPAAPGELTVQQVMAQVVKVQELMKQAMVKDEHYGVIPGTNKPTLLKAGAEKLCLMFRLDPQYSVHEIREGEHLTITSTCTLYHITSGARMGSGMGSCSTRESKYAYRKAERICPKCGKAAIIKGQEKYGGGWVCWKKKDGCGEQFPDGAAEIETQVAGRIANNDIADQYNTVLKMANKRSLCAGVLNVTAASDIFTQDMEDLQERMEPVNVTPADEKKDEPKTEKRQRATKAKDADKAKAAAAAELMSPDQSFELEELLQQSANIDATKQAIIEQFGVLKLEELTAVQAGQVIAIIKRKLARSGGAS